MQLKQVRKWLAMGVLLPAFAACTKTETTPYPEASQSRLLSYQIVNAQDTITGAVNEQNKTITVYLSSTTFLRILETKITVSPGATVTPANGSFVEDVLGYFGEGRNIEYIVKGKDSSTSKYKLNIVSLQPEIAFNEVTTNPAQPLTFNNSRSWFDGNNVITLVPLSPYSFDQNEVLKAWLVGEDGKEYAFTSVTGGENPVARLADVEGYEWNVKTAPPAGLYKVKVQYYSKFTTLQNPIKIEYL